MKYDNTQLMLPIQIGTMFSLLTVVLFYFGPINYQLNNGFIVALYILTAIVLLNLGYLSGLRNKYTSQIIKYGTTGNKNVQYNKYSFGIMSVIYILLAALMLYSRTGSMKINVGAFKDLGSAYYARATITTNLNIERLLILLSPLSIAYIPYGILRWRHLNLPRKGVFCGAIVLRVFVDIIQGINKGLADVIIFLVIFGIISISSPTLLSRVGESRFKKRLFGILFILSISLIVFFMYFSSTILSRTMQDSGNYLQSWKALSSYLTQGYQAIDYSLSQPFTSTFGFGNSMYLLDVSRSLFNTDYFFDRSYTIKNMVRFGWDYRMHWSSFYVWVGNDVSMLGVLPIMFIIGRLFAKVWSKALYENDFSSVVLAGLLFQLIMYIPANNQIVQLQSGFFGSWFWFLYWFLHKKIKIRSVKFRLLKGDR